MTFKSKKFTAVRPLQEWRSGGGERQNRPAKLWKRWVWLIVVPLVVIGLFTYVLPIVEVTIVPTTTTHTLTLDFRIDTEIKKADEKSLTLAGVIVTEEKSAQGQYEATGEKDMGDKAAGRVVFYNETGLSQPMTAMIELEAPNGRRFVPKQNFVIPQAVVSPTGEIVKGEINVEVEAVEAGEKSNLEAGRLTIIALTPDRQGKIYAQIADPLAGGTSKIVKVVSQEDIDLAQAELVEKLKAEIAEAVRNLITQAEKVEEDLINWNILASEKSVEVDKETQNFEMRIVLQGKALVYNHNELEKIFQNQIMAQIGPDSKIVDSANNKIGLTVGQLDSNGAWADVTFKAENQIASQINFDELKKEVAGKKGAEARRALMQHKEIRDVRFNYRYSLTDRIPRHINRIKFFLKS